MTPKEPDPGLDPAVTRARVPVERPLPRTPAWAVLTAAAALLVLVVGTWYAASLHDAFDLVERPLSDLGAQDAPSRGVFGVALVLVGVLLAITGWGMRAADVAGRWLLGSAGVVMVALAVLPNQTMGRFTLRHVLMSEFTLVLLALWPAFSGHVGQVVWPLRRRVGVVVSMLTFVLLQATLWSIILRTTTIGGLELGLYLWVVAWPLLVALWSCRDPGVATVLVDPPDD